MKDLFQEILGMDNVYGAMLVSEEGDVAFGEFSPALAKKPEDIDWKPFLNSVADTGEAILVFDHRRLYVRKSESGFIIVVLGHVAPVSMVRLSCDAIVPSLVKATKKKGGFGRFFRRK